jgi:hypothetical protein
MGMDWNTVLFAARWAIIALFYIVLMVLLVGVYREASLSLGRKSGSEAITYGRLRIIHPGTDPGLSAGAIFELKTLTLLGAEQDNDIVLRDRFVSGHHLRLRWDGVVWWLEDLNSKNGTLVNRQPCPPGRPQAIPKGTIITAGEVVMELVE